MATQAELEQRLRSAALATGGQMSDLQVQDLAARVLRYRDHEKGGLIKDLEELRKLEGVDQRVLNSIKAECGIGSFNIRSVEVVGPRASAQLRKQALLATAGALGGMLVYIAFRFRLISGVAAVIATVHDVVITLGLFSL